MHTFNRKGLNFLDVDFILFYFISFYLLLLLLLFFFFFFLGGGLINTAIWATQAWRNLLSLTCVLLPPSPFGDRLTSMLFIGNIFFCIAEVSQSLLVITSQWHERFSRPGWSTHGGCLGFLTLVDFSIEKSTGCWQTWFWWWSLIMIMDKEGEDQGRLKVPMWYKWCWWWSQSQPPPQVLQPHSLVWD